MDPYRSFLLGISDELTQKEVEKLTYLFRIPKGRAEKIESGTDLFGYLEERALLKPGKFDELRNPLLTIKRLDLVHKIDDYVGSQSNAGIQESESGESSKSESHVDIRKFHSHCEKNGYGVKVVDGNHFSQNKSNFAELKVGNTFHVELSNSNDDGCIADISFAKHDGSKQETLGIRLEGRHGKVTIYGSSDVHFVFNMEGTSTSSGSSTKPFLEVTFNRGEYIIFFHTREVEQNSKNIFSEVMKVFIPKVNEIKVGDVLQRLQVKYPNVAGSYFNYGQKILGAEELLRFVSRYDPM